MKKHYPKRFRMCSIATNGFFSLPPFKPTTDFLRLTGVRSFLLKENLFWSPCFLVVISLFLVCASSCRKESPAEVQPLGTISSQSGGGVASAKVHVNNVDELYTAVNDPENDGKTIILAEGTYMLNPAYPKSGRIELLHNMSLIGEEGHADKVIIDATLLPASSLIIPPTPLFPATLRTAAIRMGNGKNSVEWISFQNDPAHSIRALIQTDLAMTMVTEIKIAHCVIKGSSIGLCIINRDPTSSNRKVEADVEDNEIMDNTVLQFGAGIFITNSMHATDATIRATLRRNYFHGNRAGLLVANSGVEGSLIEIKSYADRIESNGMGLGFTGGFCEPTGVSLYDTIKFDAYGSRVRNNGGNPAPPFSYFPAGVYVTGADAYPPFGLPGAANHNNVYVGFHGCDISGNAGTSQLFAYGGHSFFPSTTPVGTYNSATVYLYGLSSQASVQAINSVPVEPAGTNTVAVFASPE